MNKTGDGLCDDEVISRWGVLLGSALLQHLGSFSLLLSFRFLFFYLFLVVDILFALNTHNSHKHWS